MFFKMSITIIYKFTYCFLKIAYKEYYAIVIVCEFVKDLANFILNILWVVFHGLIIISEKTYDGTLHSLCQEERLPFNLCIDSRWGVTGRVHHFPMGSLMASLFHLLKAHSQTLSLLW